MLGDYDHEFKIDPVTGGLHEDPASVFEVTLTLKSTADGQTFDWVSNLPVDAVFAKGGPGGNLYVYNGGAMSDTGLHAPGNDQGTAVSTPPWSGLSHISFCFKDEKPTPTPSPTPTPAPTRSPEGTQAGSTGTPAGSLVDSATSVGGFSSPVVTIVFGLILIASLGALAYANMSAVRRRS